MNQICLRPCHRKCDRVGLGGYRVSSTLDQLDGIKWTGGIRSSLGLKRAKNELSHEPNLIFRAEPVRVGMTLFAAIIGFAEQLKTLLHIEGC